MGPSDVSGWNAMRTFDRPFGWVGTVKLEPCAGVPKGCASPSLVKSTV